MKAYFFEMDDWDGSGIAIIAENTKDARKIAAHYNEGYSYTEMCKHIMALKTADVTGLKKGIADDQITQHEGVRRGLYGWTIGNCPKCSEEAELILQNDGEVYCNQCFENRNEKIVSCETKGERTMNAKPSITLALALFTAAIATATLTSCQQLPVILEAKAEVTSWTQETDPVPGTTTVIVAVTNDTDKPRTFDIVLKLPTEAGNPYYWLLDPLPVAPNSTASVTAVSQKTLRKVQDVTIQSVTDRN